MDESVLSRIDQYVNRVNDESTSKSNAVKIINLIIKEDRDNRMMLTMLRENIEAYYDNANELTKKQFVSVMEFYDVISSKRSFDQRRTVIEQLGGEEIKSKYILKSIKEIKELL